MTIPEWADETLSRELPILRAKGEGQNLEYIQAFPGQARELGKEIAAFATSNAGMILLGVTNNGDLEGLDDMETPEGRDRLLRRLEGVSSGTVKPSITPFVSFAVENDKVVLAISVPKGLQPIYYCQNIAYVRHITESRPAEPHEIIELIQGWPGGILPSHNQAGTKFRFYADLNNALTSILIFGNEIEHRSVNPWLDLAKAQFGNAASDLRALAATDSAASLGIASELEQMAQEADEVRSYRHHLGKESWERFLNLVRSTTDHAARIRQSYVDSISPRKDLLEYFNKALVAASRLLKSLAPRIMPMAESGRIREAQEQISGVGLKLLGLSYSGLSDLDSNILQDIRSIATDTHLIETTPIRMDGGRSIRSIQERVERASQSLEDIINGLGLGRRATLPGQ